MTSVTFTERGESVTVEIPDERWVEACNMARARLHPNVQPPQFDAKWHAAHEEWSRKE